jgi:hypothetical protein
MTTNFQFAQAPNRKGNISKHAPSKSGGATNVTGAAHGTATPKGNQGAPKANGNVYPVGNKVSVSTHADYCGTIKNDGYLKNSSYTK